MGARFIFVELVGHQAQPVDELVRQDTVQPCRAAAGTQVIADRFKQRIIGGGAGQLEVNGFPAVQRGVIIMNS